MTRILGIDIPDNKRLEISLTYIYGIGKKRAKEVVAKLGLDPNMKAKNLTFEDISKINALLQEYVLEGDLKRQVQGDIQRLIKINCYRGLRHRLGLPTRGQRTSSNARTRKGRKKTIAGKKLK
ncbi:MAG: 30S ribosomal protein S13 [Chlamydiae bacterium SM23_39]|nr:MAG: 30S ribosomal protein S13 [Chlamydiae bacterium SM23_39]